MKLQPVLQQLMSIIPKYTTLLTNQAVINSATITDQTITLTTTEAYNFQKSNDFTTIVLVNLYECFDIVSYSFSNTYLTITTQRPHGYKMSINLISKTFIPEATLINNSNSLLNGTFTIISVESLYTLTIELPSTFTGDGPDGQIINYTRHNLDGLITATCVDDYTLSFEVSGDMTDVILSGFGVSYVHGNFMCSTAANFQRADALYNQYINNVTDVDTYFMMLTINNEQVDKSRQTLSGATALNNKGSDPTVLVISDMNCYIFAPSFNDETGGVTVENMDNIRIAILKALQNVSDLRTNSSPGFNYSYVSGREQSYNSSYYVYNYQFELCYYISYADGYTDSPIYPLTQFNWTYNISSQTMNANESLLTKK